MSEAYFLTLLFAQTLAPFAVVAALTWRRFRTTRSRAALVGSLAAISIQVACLFGWLDVAGCLHRRIVVASMAVGTAALLAGSFVGRRRAAERRWTARTAWIALGLLTIYAATAVLAYGVHMLSVDCGV